ncbi:Fpg/Nei family DNA glycosylase [Paenibacillus sp. JCM 10914]|uniref:DNA-formamidopyrimidine glycosylase n=1 Tax=Paenibacillus sp. JCM 10914 TaxID=1236974 RepID=UPI0003CCAE53|nr:DNA-formamidopyrimidine glycosylase [Paenibacillus sp. JCM 10914]GAE05357.1 formamidopyrimidine-DNA glycosylase [Paenibacillus sp. JCM 10914]
MPELPEMENYRKRLSQSIVNVPITNVVVNREKSLNVAVDEFQSALQGGKIIFVERRGKHLIFHLHNGGRLLLHLMLGGLLYLGRTDEERPSRSTQIEITFGDHVLYFIGLRLGYLHLLSARDTDEALKELGPELLDRRMNKSRFMQLIGKRRGALKNTLVNQHVVAGIGNCYADEITFDARIHPLTKIQDLTDEQLEQLYDSTVKVLNKATDGGGYMEMPFQEGDQLTGAYNDACKVYDREGEPCVRCQTPIVKAEHSSRKVFYCPNCQHEA